MYGNYAPQADLGYLTRREGLLGSGSIKVAANWVVSGGARWDLEANKINQYIVGADDMLQVSVWKEPDLTNTLPVRPDGKISLPLLNDVQAAGLTPMQLAASITERLKKFLADPRVTVVVTQINSQRVYVLGEVLHTGAMNLLPNMTVLQALATAGFSAGLVVVDGGATLSGPERASE